MSGVPVHAVKDDQDDVLFGRLIKGRFVDLENVSLIKVPGLGVEGFFGQVSK